MKPSNHTNYYGLVFGGNALDGPSQTYTYFVVAQNGQFLIKQRNGEQTTDVQRHHGQRRDQDTGRLGPLRQRARSPRGGRHDLLRGQ